MDRSEFLKKAGVGSVALGSVPALAGTAWAGGHHHKDHGNHTGFEFLVLSAVSGKPDRMIIGGRGRFHDTKKAHGGGTFDQFLNMGSPPLPLVASGTWEARDVVSWAPGGTHGRPSGRRTHHQRDLQAAGGEAHRGRNARDRLQPRPCRVHDRKAGGRCHHGAGEPADRFRANQPDHRPHGLHHG
jgi:hypothetical protein